MTLKAFVSGSAGLELSADERDFFAAERPLGLILFERNCDTPAQIRGLAQAFRDAVADPRALVLIDQEGGRIQRLRPPHWRRLPPMRALGEYYRMQPEAGIIAAELVGRLLAHDLLGIGVNVNCAPVLDVPVPGAHDVIGDRAFAEDPATVMLLGRAVAEGHLAGGVLPVIKHLPGHGRATADSHEETPVISSQIADMQRTDFATFRALNDMPLAMTAHIVLTALDAANPVSTSPRVISEILRGDIGFDGLLMSDDVSMGALQGDLAARSRAVIQAGCDVILHCNGDFDEMLAVAANAPVLEGRPLQRFDAALERIAQVEPFDIAAAEAAVNAVEGAFDLNLPG